MSETSTRIRVLAYIFTQYLVASDLVGGGTKEKFFAIDVSVELVANVDGKPSWQLLGDYSDGRRYSAFEDAADSVLQEFGLKMDLLPESEWVHIRDNIVRITPGMVAVSPDMVRVSANVVEFAPNAKPREQIERESAALRLSPQSYLRPRVMPESVD